MSLLTADSFTIALISVVFILSLGLTLIMGIKTKKVGNRSLIFWFSAMIIFTLSVLLEILFAVGLYDEISLKVYLFLVAAIVELLAAGSIFLTSNRTLHIAYASYSVISSAALALSLYLFPLGRMVISHVFYGPLPLADTLFSSAITFPAAVIIVVKAAADLRKGINLNLISIISGVVVVSIAGTLYIAGFPAFLYLAEFIGILLLWFGFIRMPKLNGRSGLPQKF